MSYLDLPRLLFGGLFYTAPSTINNRTQNYTPTVPLENASDQYIPVVAGWNPTGVAQWWLEQCSVLSGVGEDGLEVTSNGSDSVIGAAVTSPSPTAPMSDGATGYYDIAKMVDLDPDQQGRSALYGVRIAVTLASGAGFQGLLTVPELRQLNGRIAGAGSSYGAVGNWMGTLQDVVWSGDVSGSKLLTALKAAGTNGLAVKMTVDLHQNNPQNIFTTGNMFLYGRVLGSIGPALSGELSQVVPGRCIQTAPPPATASFAAAAAAPMMKEGRRLQGRDLVVAKTAAMAMTDALAAAAPPPAPWNPAFCVIRNGFLSVDIGACMLLTGNGSFSDGTFVISDGIEIGTLNGGTFTPFTNGALSFDKRYQQLNTNQKNCVLPNNCGVFTIAMTAADLSSAAATPLAIQVSGTTVAQELANGYWIDLATASQRLQCGGAGGTDQIMVRQFGNPVAGQPPPVTVTVQLVEWILVNGKWTNPQNLPVSTDLSITFGNTDASGIASVATAINIASNDLPAIRQPLDSYMYYISMTDPDQNPTGDGAPAISVLLWNPFQGPVNPAWSDVSPVLTGYARLYPGMKSILDIGDETTVTGFAPALLARMSAPMLDPAFMPVTRDLSPTKTEMVLTWLKSVQETS